MERSSMVGGDEIARGFSVVAFYCVPLQLNLTYVNQSKALVPSEVNPLLITNRNIRLNRTAGRLEASGRKDDKEESVGDRGTVEVVEA
jgi:hypothetical protein